MQDLTFCHGEGTVAVLEGCNLRVEDGDHCLLTGPSGSGKSTLAMLLAGLHRPSAGHLSIYGVRWQEASDWAWSRLVTSAPQFHENRILNASLAFNLLMGRRWPPEPEDLQAAFETCDALGLGELVRRMPNGLQQTVGESGWQLSHGECSRIYLARALLQETPVVVLDETFGALDDDALRQCIEVARKKTRTLFVIAHP